MRERKKDEGRKREKENSLLERMNEGWMTMMAKIENVIGIRRKRWRKRRKREKKMDKRENRSRKEGESRKERERERVGKREEEEG